MEFFEFLLSEINIVPGVLPSGIRFVEPDAVIGCVPSGVHRVVRMTELASVVFAGLQFPRPSERTPRNAIVSAIQSFDSEDPPGKILEESSVSLRIERNLIIHQLLLRLFGRGIPFEYQNGVKTRPSSPAGLPGRQSAFHRHSVAAGGRLLQGPLPGWMTPRCNFTKMATSAHISTSSHRLTSSKKNSNPLMPTKLSPTVISPTATIFAQIFTYRGGGIVLLVRNRCDDILRFFDLQRHPHDEKAGTRNSLVPGGSMEFVRILELHRYDSLCFAEILPPIAFKRGKGVRRNGQRNSVPHLQNLYDPRQRQQQTERWIHRALWSQHDHDYGIAVQSCRH
ncbi:unnamed protein product [Nesidiocoris tenuis]|uniref:Uncharacterized protein n=1 Tax=Nesidiocoris tenuis TaxID=355587 RepID=A0A6H5GFX0_9HEMI|nr:unnamed protein product [Nesidiocoris tenuis]